jgi:hypothetical protein
MKDSQYDVDGITIWMAPLDDIVKINKMVPVTNPVLVLNGRPTPDGLLSYEIFGIGASRAQICSYIDLGDMYVMNPDAAKIVKQFDRRIYDMIMADKYFVVKDGELVEDPVNGSTGSTQLYKIWDKLVMKDKSGITSNLLRDAFAKIPKEQLFHSKFPVIPAAYRDIDLSVTGIVQVDEINSIYSKVISYSNDVNIRDEGFGVLKTMTNARIQSLALEVYDLLMIKKNKGQPSKYGHYKRSIVSKEVDYTSSAIITAASAVSETPDRMLVKFAEDGVPLSHLISLFQPFTVHYVKNYFENLFVRSGPYPIKNSKGEEIFVSLINEYDELYIQHQIVKFIKSPESRFDKVEIPFTNDDGKPIYIPFEAVDSKGKTISRDMTWTDVFYIAMYAFCVEGQRIIDTVRYPIEAAGGSRIPVNISILSTVKTIELTHDGKLYYWYPDVNLKLPTEKTNNYWHDTIQKAAVYHVQFGADHDGDKFKEEGRFSTEATKEGNDFKHDVRNFLRMDGSFNKEFQKEYLLTAYMLTKNPEKPMKDININKPKYSI